MPVPPNGATLDDVVETLENLDIPAPPPPEGGATEAKQDDIIAAIEAISVPAPVGGALEETQLLVLDELQGQSNTLTDIKAAVEDNDTPATVAQDASIIRIGGVDLVPKFAAISASAPGDNAVVAAVTDKKIRVLDYVITRAGDVNAKFRSGTTDITGLLYKSAAPGYTPVGHFETAVGAALNINLSAAVGVGGHVTYIEV